MYAGVDYDYNCGDNKPAITVRPDRVSDDDALTIEVDESFSQSLEKVLEMYRVKKWDGFNKFDKNVLDGSSFSLSASFDDDSRIFAHGYMKYPKYYPEVKAELDELFVSRYEMLRPNKLKVMKNYYEQVILKHHPRLENQSVTYPYLSDGADMFRLGKCECTGGAAMCPVYGYGNDPEYMLIICLCENEAHPDSWSLSCEVYKITEKGEVLEWGKAEIDPNFFSSDKLCGHIFTRCYDSRIQLGCFTRKVFTASGRDMICYIDLYDIEDKLRPLANEKVKGPPNDKQWWTPDKLACFVSVADNFGFAQSKQKWEKDPDYPVFASGMDDQTNHRFDFYLTNDHDRDFYNTLLNTPKGKPVEGYQVSGKLYFN